MCNTKAHKLPNATILGSPLLCDQLVDFEDPSIDWLALNGTDVKYVQDCKPTKGSHPSTYKTFPINAVFDMIVSSGFYMGLRYKK